MTVPFQRARRNQQARQGRVVLVQHRDIHDPETGASYTVKRYESDKVGDSTGHWHHTEIRLKPENPEFDPIVLAHVPEGEVSVVAELVEVLRPLAEDESRGSET
ncbi:MAG: LexA family protein [Acidobacteriota bacterium]